MPKFNLYYGVESEQFNLHIEQAVELKNLHTAMKESKEFAEDLYMQNPEKDIMDIMREDKCNEQIANYLFNIEMTRKIVYHVEELIEFDGQVVEVIRHDFK